MKANTILVALAISMLWAGTCMAQEIKIGPFTINPGPDDHFQRFLGHDVTVSTLNDGLIQGNMTQNYMNDFEVFGMCGKFAGKTIYVTKSSVVYMYEGYSCGG
jgi:hypothetical protein